jgi:hypothetical protein
LPQEFGGICFGGVWRILRHDSAMNVLQPINESLNNAMKHRNLGLASLGPFEPAKPDDALLLFTLAL